MAVTLHLQNFRCYDDAVVLLKPFTLLNGASGTGKTTLLKALVFVLTGKEKQGVKFGRKSCCVTAYFTIGEASFTVVRSCRPNRLTVRVQEAAGCRQAEDAVAQSWLNAAVLADRISLGYVAQNATSFLAMTPAERFLLIRSVLIDEQKMDYIKTRLKAVKSLRQKKFDVVSGKLAAYNTVSSDGAGSEEDPELLSQELEKLRRHVTAVERDNALVRSVKERLVTLPVRSPETIRAELEAVDTALPFLDQWHETGRPDVGSIEAVPLVEAVALEKRLQENLSCLELSLEKTGTPYDCPNCRAKLVLRNKSLSLNPYDELAPEDGALSRKLAMVQTHLCDLRNQLDGVDRNLYDRPLPAKAKTLYDLYPAKGIADPLWSLPPADLRLRKDGLHRELTGRLERESLESMSLPEERSVSNKLAEMACLEKRLSNAVIGQQNRIKILSRGAKIEASLAADALARTSSLACLVGEAEAICLTDGLTVINSALDELVKRMSCAKLTASLRLETKMGTQKLKIDIVNNGMATDQSTLSGGEAARVNIAFATILAVIKNLPFLMLDEATSSLDQETADVVIDAVRDVYKGTLICVAHQTVHGRFDHVIDVHSLGPQNST